MAPIDYLEDPPDIEENYRESSDEDFNPAAAPADDSSSSSDEEDAPSKPTQQKRKRKAPSPDDLDSGDEVTIEAARKRRIRGRKGGNGGDDIGLLSDDEGGEGGLVKTRAQRRVELKERRPLARTEGATVDVDALWAQMSAAPLRPLYTGWTETQDPNTKEQDVSAGVHEEHPPGDDDTDLVAVEKVYTFAGQRTTEEKQIPRSSLDKYVSDGWRTVEPTAGPPDDAPSKPESTTSAAPNIRRPLRRPSRFDANPTGFVRTLAPEHQFTWPRKTASAATGQENLLPIEGHKAPRVEKAHKLNVVDKSRLDWTGFVHKEGIAEELDVHGKAKEAYLGRMQFLAGVEAKQEEERKRLKMAGAA